MKYLPKFYLSVAASVMMFSHALGNDQTLPIHNGTGDSLSHSTQVKPFSLLETYLTADDITVWNVSIKTVSKQPVSGGLRFVIKFFNKHERIATLANPLKSLVPQVLDDAGNIAELPFAGAMNHQLPRSNSDALLLPFKVIGATLDGKKLSQREIASNRFSVPPSKSLEVLIQINKILAPSKEQKERLSAQWDGRKIDPDLITALNGINVPKGLYNVRFIQVLNTLTEEPEPTRNFFWSNPIPIDLTEDLGDNLVTTESALGTESKVLNQPEAGQLVLPINSQSPNFSVPDMNGTMRRLSDLKGKKHLLLTFFPKCFTGGCTNHLSSLRDVYPMLQANDVEVLAVSVDPADGEKGQKAFAAQWKLPFPLIPDTQRKLSMLYGAAQNTEQLATRMSVLIDKNGVVRFLDTNVNVRTHGNDMLAKVRELGLSSQR
jgi:peroxiredoxin Q/BCP